jgi:hypothetical protein
LRGYPGKTKISALYGRVDSLAKFEERKLIILEMAQRLGRPIWVGDVTLRVADQEKYRPAFRALVDDGKLVRRPGAKGSRSYYYFD